MNKTQANKKARIRIAEIAEENNLTRCELNFEGCLGTFGVAPAHRHFRNWYNGDWKKLSDFDQWVVACQHCHQILDDRSKTTEKKVEIIFNKLRC